METQPTNAAAPEALDARGRAEAVDGEGGARARSLRHPGGRALRELAGPGALVALLAAGYLASTHNLVNAAFGGAASSSAGEPVQLHLRCVPRLLSDQPSWHSY